MRDNKETQTEPKSLRSNALWNSFGSMFYMGCQWLITVFVVILSPNFDNSGILAYAMSVGLIFSAMGTYSIRPFQISDLDNEYSSSNYTAFRLITNTLSLLICIIYILAITPRFDLITASILYLAFKFDESFSDVLYGIYQKNDRMDYIGRSQIARGAASLAFFSVALFLSSSIFVAIICMSLSCIAITVVYDYPHASLFGVVTPKITVQKASKLLKTCFWAMLANVLLVYVVSAVRQYYGIVEGDEALGIYAAIATPAVVVQAAINYIYTPLLVPLAKSTKQGKREFLRYFIKIIFILIGFIAVASVALSIICPPILIIMFGDSIAADIGIFPYVILSTALVGLLGYVFTTLVAIRKQLLAAVMTAIAFLASISSAIPFISFFGMNGVNLGIICGCLIGLLTGFAFVVASSSVKSTSKKVLK